MAMWRDSALDTTQIRCCVPREEKGHPSLLGTWMGTDVDLHVYECMHSSV